MPATVVPATSVQSGDSSSLSGKEQSEGTSQQRREQATTEGSSPAVETTPVSSRSGFIEGTTQLESLFEGCSPEARLSFDNQQKCLEILAKGTGCPSKYWGSVREILVKSIDAAASRRDQSTDTGDAIKQRKWMCRYLTSLPVPPNNGLQRVAECCLDDATWKNLDKWTFAVLRCVSAMVIPEDHSQTVSPNTSSRKRKVEDRDGSAKTLVSAED